MTPGYLFISQFDSNCGKGRGRPIMGMTTKPNMYYLAATRSLQERWGIM